MKQTKKHFPNGFSNWQETHFEISAAIGTLLQSEEFDPEFKNVVTERYENNGRGGIYELAEELTDKFELDNKGRIWDGDYHEAIDSFIKTELK